MKKNQRARGDYGVLHRSLEAVESKKILDTVATPQTIVASHYSLLLNVTIHCTVHYSLQRSLFFVDFSLSKSVDSDSAMVELGTQQRMVAE
jgi:hypothetical protein